MLSAECLTSSEFGERYVLQGGHVIGEGCMLRVVTCGWREMCAPVLSHVVLQIEVSSVSWVRGYMHVLTSSRIRSMSAGDAIMM